MSPSPFVSVLMPCYNEERVLEATVIAILDSRGEVSFGNLHR